MKIGLEQKIRTSSRDETQPMRQHRVVDESLGNHDSLIADHVRGVCGFGWRNSGTVDSVCMCVCVDVCRDGESSGEVHCNLMEGEDTRMEW